MLYEFDGFQFDVTRGVLSDSAGAELALRAKSFACLRYLLERAGTVVSRQELLANIWPDVVVCEDSISQCVRDIRRVLGDDGRLLRTVPRRGYQLAVASRIDDADQCRVPLPAPNRPVVTVLPFEDLSGDSAALFGRGLMAELVTDLTGFQALHVIAAKTSGARWHGVHDPMTTTDYVISGSVRLERGRVRVIASLDDARSRIRMLSERWDRPLEDLFEVQVELAESIAARLIAQVAHEGLRLAWRRPPETLAAYQLCLRGAALLEKLTAADTIAARELFTNSITADPGYADAHAYHAFAVQRGFTNSWGEPRGQAALDLALSFARRAVELEPASPRCMAVLGFILMLLRQWDEALGAAEQAVRLNPGAWYGRASYGEILSFAGDPAGAVRETRLSLMLDPYHGARMRHQLGRALLLDERPDEALTELRPLASRLARFPAYHQTVTTAAVEAGEINEARAAVQRLAALEGAPPTLRLLAPFWGFRRAADVDRFRAAHEAAGVAAR